MHTVTLSFLNQKCCLKRLYTCNVRQCHISYIHILLNANDDSNKNLVPALNRTCKKLNVDCASALVGFDYHSGGCHPTYDGFIVCEEFAELVVAQYWLDQEEAQRREEEKVQQRVYGNWKKLIRGLLIRQRLQRKYNFNESGGVSTASPEKPTTTATTKKSSSKRSRK